MLYWSQLFIFRLTLNTKGRSRAGHVTGRGSKRRQLVIRAVAATAYCDITENSGYLCLAVICFVSFVRRPSHYSSFLSDITTNSSVPLLTTTVVFIFLDKKILPRSHGICIDLLAWCGGVSPINNKDLVLSKAEAPPPPPPPRNEDSSTNSV